MSPTSLGDQCPDEHDGDTCLLLSSRLPGLVHTVARFQSSKQGSTSPLSAADGISFYQWPRQATGWQRIRGCMKMPPLMRRVLTARGKGTNTGWEVVCGRFSIPQEIVSWVEGELFSRYIVQARYYYYHYCYLHPYSCSS